MDIPLYQVDAFTTRPLAGNPCAVVFDGADLDDGTMLAIAKEMNLSETSFVWRMDDGRFPFQANGKALGLGDYAGWVKIVVDEKYGEILGAHMIGPEVTELLPELTLAHLMELTPHEIARNVHAHPTLSEVLMEAAHAAEGSPIHI